jgi:alpha-1,2-mannosyltransferase
VTLAWITALPGPGVGPLPATGLISLQPDVDVVAVVVVLAVAHTNRARHPENLCAGPRR